MPAWLHSVADHLWQSTLFAVAAAVVALMLRKNSAHVRYWLWFSASVKFLAPFSVLVAAGAYFGQHTTTVAGPRPELPYQIEQALITLIPASPSMAGVTPSRFPFRETMPTILSAIWAVGFTAIVCSLLMKLRRMQTALRNASHLDLPIGIAAVTSPAFGEPGVFGVRKPILLLPEGIRAQLTEEEFQAIISHELCHVRRRDNLTAVAHMAVEALFWFHPLVWWLGARIVEERERACDEEVLKTGTEPRVYADGILKVCQFYLESPLRCVAGVTGGGLTNRIEAIMSNRTALKLGIMRRVALATVSLTALTLPVFIGVMNAPVIVAQAPARADTVQAAQPDPKPVPPRIPIPPAPSQPEVTPRFDVASIRPCNPDIVPAGGRSGPAPTGTFRNNCRTLRSLIEDAYIRFADGKIRSPMLTGLTKIEGGPGWIDSGRYTIEAKSEDVQPVQMKAGPMMQALLEDRFQLRVHRETREGLTYDLTIAKGGSKVQPAKQGPCLASDLAGSPLPPLLPRPGDDRQCNLVWNGRKGPNAILVARSSSMENFAAILTMITGQLVVDKTGINELIDYRLVYFPEDGMPNLAPANAPDGASTSDDSPAASIFTVLQQELGLRLERARGAREYLVIDHIERPSAN
ncbi:MAG TPA: M56 family metallopeptidase [Bryobacteraceae bacterium]|nr:M56 family metallopeptidase [Bryobacteraceae bacterium]